MATQPQHHRCYRPTTMPACAALSPNHSAHLDPRQRRAHDFQCLTRDDLLNATMALLTVSVTVLDAQVLDAPHFGGVCCVVSCSGQRHKTRAITEEPRAAAATGMGAAEDAGDGRLEWNDGFEFRVVCSATEQQQQQQQQQQLRVALKVARRRGVHAPGAGSLGAGVLSFGVPTDADGCDAIKSVELFLLGKMVGHVRLQLRWPHADDAPVPGRLMGAGRLRLCVRRAVGLRAAVAEHGSDVVRVRVAVDGGATEQSTHPAAVDVKGAARWGTRSAEGAQMLIPCNFTGRTSCLPTLNVSLSNGARTTLALASLPGAARLLRHSQARLDDSDSSCDEDGDCIVSLQLSPAGTLDLDLRCDGLDDAMHAAHSPAPKNSPSIGGAKAGPGGVLWVHVADAVGLAAMATAQGSGRSDAAYVCSVGILPPRGTAMGDAGVVLAGVGCSSRTSAWRPSFGLCHEGPGGVFGRKMHKLFVPSVEDIARLTGGADGAEACDRNDAEHGGLRVQFVIGSDDAEPISASVNLATISSACLSSGHGCRTWQPRVAEQWVPCVRRGVHTITDLTPRLLVKCLFLPAWLQGDIPAGGSLGSAGALAAAAAEALRAMQAAAHAHSEQWAPRSVIELSTLDHQERRQASKIVNGLLAAGDGSGQVTRAQDLFSLHAKAASASGTDDVTWVLEARAFELICRQSLTPGAAQIELIRFNLGSGFPSGGSQAAVPGWPSLQDEFVAWWAELPPTSFADEVLRSIAIDNLAASVDSRAADLRKADATAARAGEIIDDMAASREQHASYAHPPPAQPPSCVSQTSPAVYYLSAHTSGVRVWVTRELEPVNQASRSQGSKLCAARDGFGRLQVMVAELQRAVAQAELRSISAATQVEASAASSTSTAAVTSGAVPIPDSVFLRIRHACRALYDLRRNVARLRTAIVDAADAVLAIRYSLSVFDAAGGDGKPKGALPLPNALEDVLACTEAAEGLRAHLLGQASTAAALDDDLVTLGRQLEQLRTESNHDRASPSAQADDGLAMAGDEAKAGYEAPAKGDSDQQHARLARIAAADSSARSVFEGAVRLALGLEAVETDVAHVLCPILLTSSPYIDRSSSTVLGARDPRARWEQLVSCIGTDQANRVLERNLRPYLARAHLLSAHSATFGDWVTRAAVAVEAGWQQVERSSALDRQLELANPRISLAWARKSAAYVRFVHSQDRSVSHARGSECAIAFASAVKDTAEGIQQAFRRLHLATVASVIHSNESPKATRWPSAGVLLPRLSALRKSFADSSVLVPAAFNALLTRLWPTHAANGKHQLGEFSDGDRMLLLPVTPLLLHIFGGPSLWMSAGSGTCVTEISTFPVHALDDTPVAQAVVDFLAHESAMGTAQQEKAVARSATSDRGGGDVLPAVQLLAEEASAAAVLIQASVRRSQCKWRAKNGAAKANAGCERRRYLAEQVKGHLAAHHYTEAKLCAQYVLGGFSVVVSGSGDTRDCCTEAAGDSQAIVRAIAIRRERSKRQLAVERDIVARLERGAEPGSGGQDAGLVLARLRLLRVYQRFVLHGLPASGGPQLLAPGQATHGISSSGDLATDVRRVTRFLMSSDAMKKVQGGGGIDGSTGGTRAMVSENLGQARNSVPITSVVLVKMLGRAHLPAPCPSGPQRIELVAIGAGGASSGSIELVLESVAPPEQSTSVTISSVCMAAGGLVDMGLLPSGQRLAGSPDWSAITVLARMSRADGRPGAVRTTSLVVPQSDPGDDRATVQLGERLTFPACSTPDVSITFEVWRGLHPLERHVPAAKMSRSAASPKRHPLRPPRHPRAQRQLRAPSGSIHSAPWRERDLSTHPSDSVTLRSDGIPDELRPLLQASKDSRGVDAVASARIAALLCADSTLATAQFGSSQWMTALHAAAVSVLHM